MQQIPGVLFIPLERLNGEDFEINHLGVVLRVRNGQAQHIGGVRHEHDAVAYFDKLEKQPKEYETREVMLQAQGLIQPDDSPPGFYLVPAKAQAAFAMAWEAEMKRRADEILRREQEEKAAAKRAAAAKKLAESAGEGE